MRPGQLHPNAISRYQYSSDFSPTPEDGPRSSLLAPRLPPRTQSGGAQPALAPLGVLEAQVGLVEAQQVLRALLLGYLQRVD